jgi:hypothetical protein
MQEEFKFPDEVEAESKAEPVVEESFDIQIEDDTPPEDRGRKPLPKEVVNELESDDLEDYSEKVKKRLSQMKKVWHDERREKERAFREREEALKFAQAREEEIKQLRQKVTLGQKAYIEEASKSAANDLATVKERLKQAYESGDADKITEAQEALTDAKMRIKEVERFKPALQKQESSVQETKQASAPAQSAPASDTKAESWRTKNTWFGADEEMTALALGLHEKLVRSGVDPRSDDYYSKIDQTMRKRFPEAFEDDAEQSTEEAPKQEKPRAQKAANVVAPVTRGTAPRQVRLTPTQVAIAKKLGLSNEQYARELMKLEAN